MNKKQLDHHRRERPADHFGEHLWDYVFNLQVLAKSHKCSPKCLSAVEQSVLAVSCGEVETGRLD
jgi:hypothetical protein